VIKPSGTVMLEKKKKVWNILVGEFTPRQRKKKEGEKKKRETN